MRRIYKDIVRNKNNIMGADTKKLKSPLVSIVMPAYNCESYIELAIRSVIEQTYKNWELFVIDDGSTDATSSIVKKLSKEDHRVKLINNPSNMGVAKTRNKGFELSSGEYVALLDADDVWRSTKLEKQLELAEKTGADIIYCSYGIIDEKGNSACSDFIVPETTSYRDMLVKSVISCSTALLSKNVYEKYTFRTDYYHEDLLLWLELLRDEKKALGVLDVLADYRVMKGSRSFNKVKSAINRWKIYRKCMKEPFFRSVCLIVSYSTLGLKKYRKI